MEGKEMESFTTKKFSGDVPENTMDVRSIGKGLKLISFKKVPFTHELANKYLIMLNCPWERCLRDRQVIFLAEQMKKGMFRPEITRITSCFCSVGETGSL
jgi:hypothetical protein